jgi:predicted DNA binding protein
MKTFNKTLIAAATLTTFGLAAAPAAVALGFFEYDRER